MKREAQMATTKAGTATAPDGSEALGDIAAELGQVDEQLRSFVKERPFWRC
jgi:hypothetical protein